MKQWKIATIVVLILVGILCSYFYINDHEAAAVASRYEEF